MKIAVSPANGRIVPSVTGGAFEQAQRGRADRDDASARAARRIERIGGLFGHDAVFGVHPVACGIVRLHRQKRPGADMQRDGMQADAARREPRHQLGR